MTQHSTLELISCWNFRYNYTRKPSCVISVIKTSAMQLSNHKLKQRFQSPESSVWLNCKSSLFLPITKRKWHPRPYNLRMLELLNPFKLCESYFFSFARSLCFVHGNFSICEWQSPAIEVQVLVLSLSYGFMPALLNHGNNANSLAVFLCELDIRFRKVKRIA